MSDKFEGKRCVPCEGGVAPLTNSEISDLLTELPDWKVVEIVQNDKKIKTLQKQLQFRNFREAMSFLWKIEEFVESEGHHPDFCVHYNKIDFTIWTHAIAGLHENDFIIAAGIDKLFG